MSRPPKSGSAKSTASPANAAEAASGTSSGDGRWAGAQAP